MAPHATALASELVYSGAVGTATLAMVLCGIRHPPAAGTALGAALAGVSTDAAITVLTSVAVMLLLGRMLRRRMEDLV